jgi:hypothetical protein
MKKLIKLCVLASLLISSGTLYAQKIDRHVYCAGGGLSTPSGSISFTIGEPLYTTTSYVNGSIVQGMEQKLSAPASVPAPTVSNSSNIGNSDTETTVNVNSNTIATIATAEISVYPNPAKDFVTVVSSEKDLTLHIYNVLGDLLAVHPLNSTSTIDLTNCSSGIYILKIMDKAKQIIETKRILKLN